MATISFKPLIPREFSIRDLDSEMAKEMRGIGDVMKRDFDSTVSTWSKKTKPRFKKILALNPSYIRVEVSTTSRIYGYVSEGTDAHTIRPKRKKLLRFRSGYLSKTVPGMLPARGGGSRGGFVSAREVQHPGTEARNFPDLIIKARGDDFMKRMQAAIDRGLK